MAKSLQFSNIVMSSLMTISISIISLAKLLFISIQKIVLDNVSIFRSRFGSAGVRWFMAKLKKNQENQVFLWFNLALSLFIAVIIGGIEICVLSTMHIVMLIALLCLIIINFELFFFKEKIQFKRKISNTTDLFFTSPLTRKKTLFPWVISSVILIVIFSIISCILGFFRPIYSNINWESIVVYLNYEPYFYIIIFVLLIQVGLVIFALNKYSLKEIWFLFGYIFTLRLSLLLLLNIIFCYDQEKIILSISVYDILSKKGMIENITTWLEPKCLKTVLNGLRIKKYINQLVNFFLEGYKPLHSK